MCSVFSPRAPHALLSPLYSLYRSAQQLAGACVALEAGRSRRRKKRKNQLSQTVFSAPPPIVITTEATLSERNPVGSIKNLSGVSPDDSLVSSPFPAKFGFRCHSRYCSRRLSLFPPDALSSKKAVLIKRTTMLEPMNPALLPVTGKPHSESFRREYRAAWQPMVKAWFRKVQSTPLVCQLRG